jgi:hypothetical protein
MKVVLTGMAPRDEAVLGFFLNRSMPSWSWQSAAPDHEVALPPADFYVLDLGLTRWSEAAGADLLHRLQDTPAVVLLAANDRTWSTMKASAEKHSIVWLSKPYGTQDMQSALDQAAAFARRPTAVPAAQPESVAPVIEHEENSLSAEQLKTRLAALDEANGYVFLRQLSDLLSMNHPFEARFTVQNSLIVHPADGWIATNTPMMVIQRVCQSDALASAVSMREIDGAEAEDRAQRLGMPPRELDVFLWELMESLA